MLKLLFSGFCICGLLQGLHARWRQMPASGARPVSGRDQMVGKLCMQDTDTGC
jgi:hypothetical protein